MKTRPSLYLFVALLLLGIPAFAGVQVSSPTNGATVASPAKYVASSSSACSKGVASMGVYVDNNLIYVANGNSLNTNITMSAGKHHTVVQEWDYCGGSTYTPVDVTVSTQTGVWVSSPGNGSNVGSPVHYLASASTATCAKGVASMGVYVNNQLKFVANGAHLDTNINLNAGTYDTVVEEWDYCGGAAFTHVNVTVGGGGGGGQGFTQLQNKNGWIGYGEYPPKYDICTNCGGGVTWKMTQGITSPSLSGHAAKFEIGGTHPYSDVLWTNALIGPMSTQGIKDADHKIVPNVHNFTYEMDFWGGNLELSQVLEFDINQYLNSQGFTWGHQCRIAGGHQWDIWDNVHWKWIPTGIACNPKSNAWNHLVLQVSRTADNKLRYHSITLNGVTKVLDWYYPPFGVGNWYGITANFQLDGNYQQAPYSVVVDNFNLNYW